MEANRGTRRAREETSRPGAARRAGGATKSARGRGLRVTESKRFAPLAAQAPREIPLQQAQQFLDDFSMRRDGWLTNIEIAPPGQSSRLEAHDLPLDGISFELGEQLTSVLLGKDPVDHVTHTIPLTTKIVLNTDAEVEIETADGAKTVVRCRKPEKS